MLEIMMKNYLERQKYIVYCDWVGIFSSRVHSSIGQPEKRQVQNVLLRGMLIGKIYISHDTHPFQFTHTHTQSSGQTHVYASKMLVSRFKGST